MSQRSAAITFLPLSVVIVLGLSGAAAAQTSDADISTSEEQSDGQKLPVSTLCGTEEFASQWKILDYREDQDAADLIALGKTSPKDIPLIVAQLTAPLWVHRQAAAKALGVIGKKDPAVINALQAIVDRGLPLLKAIRPEAGLSKELMEKLPLAAIDTDEATRTDAFVVIDACVSLARLGNTKPLMELVTVKNSVAQDRAFDSIVRLGLADSSFAAKIVENYNTGVWDIADAPIDVEFAILGFVGKDNDQVIEFLTHHFTTTESRALRNVCGAALWQISHTRPDVAATLVRLMNEGNLRTSSVATLLLARNDPPLQEVIQMTFRHLKRGDDAARLTALMSLPFLADDDPACLGAIEQAVRDFSFSVKVEAANMLLKNGRWNDDCLTVLTQVPTQQPNTKVPLLPFVRRFAEQSKGDRRVVDVFLEWCNGNSDYSDVYLEYEDALRLEDEVRIDDQLSVWAVRMLRTVNCRDQDVIEHLARLTTSENGNLRRAAIGTLFFLAPEDPRAIQAVKRPKDLSQRALGPDESASAENSDSDSDAQISDRRRNGFQEADRIFAECSELREVPIGLAEYFADYLLQLSEFKKMEYGRSAPAHSALTLGIQLKLSEERVMQLIEEMVEKEQFDDSKLPALMERRGVLDEFALKVLTRLMSYEYFPTRKRAVDRLGTMAQQRPDWTDSKLLSDITNPEVAVQIQASIALAYRLKVPSDAIAPETLTRLQAMTIDDDPVISLAARRAVWFIERRHAEFLPDAEWDNFTERLGVVALPDQPALPE